MQAANQQDLPSHRRQAFSRQEYHINISRYREILLRRQAHHSYLWPAGRSEAHRTGTNTNPEARRESRQSNYISYIGQY